MVKRDTREIDNLFCTSGTSPDPAALADLGADQDLAKDCTLRAGRKPPDGRPQLEATLHQALMENTLSAWESAGQETAVPPASQGGGLSSYLSIFLKC